MFVNPAPGWFSGRGPREHASGGLTFAVRGQQGAGTKDRFYGIGMLRPNWLESLWCESDAQHRRLFSLTAAQWRASRCAGDTAEERHRRQEISGPRCNPMVLFPMVL